jgi:hypothetical protein
MGLGIWNKFKEVGKWITGKVASAATAFKKFVSPLAKGAVGQFIQGATGVPLPQIASAIDGGIDFVQGLGQRRSGGGNFIQQANDLVRRGAKQFQTGSGSGIDGVLAKW